MTNKHKEPAKQPTVEELEERIHKTYHFLDDWAHSPDADNWLRYHIKVAVKIMHGENLKGTLLFNKKTGGVEIIKEDHYY